jgi:hypothetical protein
VSDAGPIVVGVTPADQLRRRPLLFAALEAALPVRFEARGPGELRGLDALLVMGQDSGSSVPPGLPSLSLAVAEPGAEGEAVSSTLTETAQLDRRLRGAKLPDDRLGAALGEAAELATGGSAAVLATCCGAPSWVREHDRERALLIPAELEPREALRERLCDKRSAALLPLLHFLRERTEGIRWRPPPARASLLFDDPNLHWPSYGFVKLADLGAHARSHGYHVALATVPLDAWFAHPAALRALRASAGAISLLVHGNDHDGAELGRQSNEAEAIALAAQALRRVEAFGRRTGLTVDRVMVPPHEACSQATAKALRRCGFEAISMTRPCPWLEWQPHSWLARPEPADPLVAWGPVDFAEELPLLLRHPLAERSPAELVLRAFLDQPLILYGHHDDLLDGPEALLEAVGEVNRLAPTRWCSLSEIATTSFETRLRPGRLDVRLLTRRARIEIPAGATELMLEAPASELGRRQQLLTIEGRHARLGEPAPVEPGSSVEVTLVPSDAVDIGGVAPPRRRPLAVARRLASEGRDRLLPLASRSR